MCFGSDAVFRSLQKGGKGGVNWGIGSVIEAKARCCTNTAPQNRKADDGVVVVFVLFVCSFHVDQMCAEGLFVDNHTYTRAHIHPFETVCVLYFRFAGGNFVRSRFFGDLQRITRVVIFVADLLLLLLKGEREKIEKFK